MSSPEFDESKLAPGTIVYKETGMPRYVRLAKTKKQQEEEEAEQELEFEGDIEDEEAEDTDIGVEEGEELEFEEEDILLELEGEKEVVKKKKEVPRHFAEGGYKEELEDLALTKVFYPTSYQEFAKQYSLPLYETKLLPQKIQRVIDKYEVVFPAVERMQVGPDGKLVPVPRSPTRIRYIDAASRKRRVLKEYVPEVTIQPNPYDQRFTIGTYVTFSGTEGEGKLSGVVVAFVAAGVTVSVNQDAAPGESKVKMYVVGYGDLTLSKPPVKRTEEVERQSPDIRESKEIPEQIRVIMVESYIDALDKLVKGARDDFVDPRLRSQPNRWRSYQY